MSRNLGQLRHLEVELISAYLDGELSVNETRDLEAHLTDCADCTRQLETMDAARTALRALPRPAPPPVIGELLRKAVAAERERRPRPQWLDTFLPWRTMQPGLAAVVLVFVMSILVVRHLEREMSRPGETVAAPRSPEEREREAAAGPTVPRPPQDRAKAVELRDSPAPLQAAAEPRADAEIVGSFEENAGAAAAQDAGTGAPAGVPAAAPAGEPATASDEFAAAPPVAPVEITSSAEVREEAVAAAPAPPESRPDAAARLSRAPSPAAAAAPRRVAGQDQEAKSAASGARTVAGRQFDLSSGIWLQRGLRPDMRVSSVLFRTDRDARKLIEQWPEIDALAAEGRAVRFRAADGRIVEIRP